MLPGLANVSDTDPQTILIPTNAALDSYRYPDHPDFRYLSTGVLREAVLGTGSTCLRTPQSGPLRL